MASLNLLKRGTVVVNLGALASPSDLFCDFAFSGSPIKVADSFRVVAIRDIRKRVRVQRGEIALTDASTSPVITTINAVDLEAAEVHATLRQSRTGAKSGATLDLSDVDKLRCKFEVLTGDTVNIDWEVKETLKESGATARILNATTLRVEFDRELEAGESITVDYEVVDFNDVGNELLQLDYKLLRLLGFSGENSVEDGLNYDQAGNPITIRIRTFDTQAHANAATLNIPDGDALETGELSRVKSVLVWAVGNNRPSSIVTTLLAEAATPGIS